jgi:hypothetical protein
MAARKIYNVNDLLNAGYACKKTFGGQHFWWRGQSVEGWDLTPQLYHKGFATNEHNLTTLFCSKARVRHAKCPEVGDWASWLFLMHHSGLPTRLLNWSESILVATFFAVSEKKYQDQPAALWGLEPTLFNESQTQRKGILVHQDELVNRLIEDAFRSNGADRPEKVIALLTEQIDVRQVVQFSTATIHGTEIPINRFSDSSRYLVKYEIPADAKVPLVQSLELLGIKKSFLFPDLQHLADDLQSIQFN